MTRPTGVIYDLRPSAANDGVHVETCGWGHYILYVSTRDGKKDDSCMVTISRRAAAMLVKEWMQHIDTMDEMDALEAEAEAEAGE